MLDFKNSVKIFNFALICHYWFINPMSYADGKLRVLPQQHMGTVESAGPGSSRWTSTGAT